MAYLLIVNCILLVIVILLLTIRNTRLQQEQLKRELLQEFSTLERSTRDEFQRNRIENAQSDHHNRTELNETLRSSLDDFSKTFERNVQLFNSFQKERFNMLETRQNELIQHTENKLEFIRAIVEEKLEKTLHERLQQSFASVSTQLTEVQKGLGEMQALAGDVGGLKKVLSNVKMRGGFGEIQLSMLLEQILSPDQFEANVKTKTGSADTVEFAIKLPGRSEQQSFVWLPIDAKFPRDAFEKVQNAYELGVPEEIEPARKSLFSTIKKMGKDIEEKYIDPPNTTDFAILFLPFEGIYAEVVRNAALLEEMQRDYRIIVTGPTTLGAILNSLQMGFKTLAIQKRSSEVWQVLGEVKTEFENFSGLLGKAHANIQTGLNQLDDVLGKRTRAIQKRLKSVEALKTPESPSIAERTAPDSASDQEED